MNKSSKTALVILAAGLAACSDGLVAPQSETPAAEAVNGGGSRQALTGSDTVKFSIRIDPSHTTYYYLGEGNSLTFPAHSLCDPNKSSYGNGEWDKPCTQATSPVTVGVKAWLDSHGHTRVDFNMHLRFVPSSNPAQWVNLTFADLQASLDPMFNIYYCQSINGSCEDETKKDPTLATVHNPITGKLTRRIKHFSGYNIAAGREQEMDNRSASTSAVTSAGLAMASLRINSMRGNSLASVFRGPEHMLLSQLVFLRRFSGYMLASG